MDSKKKMEKLDEIGFVGKQQKLTALSRQQQIKKTSNFIRAHRLANKTDNVKKAS